MVVSPLQSNFLSFAVGGKATNLHHLISNGYPVPPFIVIPAEELAKVFAMGGEDKISAIKNFKIPDSVILEAEKIVGDEKYFAVRSSALDEDGAEHSFAGQFESHLFVTKEQLAARIKDVWLSVFQERVVTYRRHHGLAESNGIAVIIQVMLNADVAGVGFGANVVSGNRKSKLISAVYGLGEGLVSGELNSDTYEVAEGKIIHREIAEKTHKVIQSGMGEGTELVAVEEKLHHLPALTDAQILEVNATLSSLFNLFKCYQDIEFAFVKNTFYLLQTRPITSLHQTADISGDHLIWDNSNIIESYPGISLPLTFSFISKVYEAVYLQFAAIMGITEKDCKENAQAFATMLGLLNGRVYYNLNSWFSLLALLPGYNLNADFMEKMMGVKEKFPIPISSPKRKKSEEWLRVAKMIFLFFSNAFQLPAMRKKFQKEFQEVLDKYGKEDFSTLNSNQLYRAYKDFEQTLLLKWKAPLVNDFMAMVFFGLLQKFTTGFKLENSSLHNDLVSCSNDIISTEPIKKVLQITQLITEDAPALELFTSQNPEQILISLKNDISYKNVADAIDAYIKKWGDRSVAELKLETITYTQNPVGLIKLLKSYAEQGMSVLNNSFNEEGIRHKAEKDAAGALKYKPFKRLLFNFILRNARGTISARENLRFERTRAFAMVRKIFIAMGEKFYAEKIISHPRDIFYLTKEEIFDFIQGTSVNTNLADLIALRKAENQKYQAQKTAERISTYGIVYCANNFNPLPKQEAFTGDLKGIGCCPGIVKGKVRVIETPDEIKSLEGDILVTSSTDPGWVTLFPSASAIIVERGSLLSHSAIVSREMGIPCIVGVKDLLQRLKTGDEVEMNGATGDIKIIIA